MFLHACYLIELKLETKRIIVTLLYNYIYVLIKIITISLIFFATKKYKICTWLSSNGISIDICSARMNVSNWCDKILEVRLVFLIERHKIKVLATNRIFERM